MVEQNSAIFSSVDSSCKNWLDGKPTTVKPRSAYVFCSCSSASYWGVSPHREATLTTSTTSSRCSASVVVVPSMRSNGMS